MLNEQAARSRYRLTIALGTVIALAAGACAFGVWPASQMAAGAPPMPVPEAEALAALARERVYALSLGYAPRASATASTNTTTLQVRASKDVPTDVSFVLGSRECAAFLVAGSGFVRPALVELRGSGRLYPAGSLTTQTPTGLVGHVQWCNLEPGDITARITARSYDPNDREPFLTGALHYEVLTAPWDTVGGIAGITRGSPNAQAVATLAAVGEEQAFAMAPSMAPPGGVASAMLPLRIGPGSSRLLPADANTYATLQRMVGRYAAPAMVSPRVDVAGMEWSGFAPGTLAPVVDVGFNQFLRVLLLLDLKTAGCVTLEFRRGMAVYSPRIARAAIVADAPGERIPLPTRENTAADHWCPAQGPVVYLTPDDDGAAYQLRVYADSTVRGTTSPSSVTPAPAGSRASRH